MMQLAVDRAVSVASAGITKGREIGENDKSAAAFRRAIRPRRRSGMKKCRLNWKIMQINDGKVAGSDWCEKQETPLFSRGLTTMGQTKLISGVVLFGFFDVSYGERN